MEGLRKGSISRLHCPLTPGLWKGLAARRHDCRAQAYQGSPLWPTEVRGRTGLRQGGRSVAAGGLRTASGLELLGRVWLCVQSLPRVGIFRTVPCRMRNKPTRSL